MTVKEFEEKQKSVVRSREDLRKGADAIAAAFDKLQDKKNGVPKEAVELVRADMNQAIMAAHAAVTELRSYENMLDDIARRTKLDWPPVCGLDT